MKSQCSGAKEEGAVVFIGGPEKHKQGCVKGGGTQEGAGEGRMETHESLNAVGQESCSACTFPILLHVVPHEGSPSL